MNTPWLPRTAVRALTAEFAYDYSALGIPPAPDTTGPTMQSTGPGTFEPTVAASGDQRFYRLRQP